MNRTPAATDPRSFIAVVCLIGLLLAMYVGSYFAILEEGRRIGRIEGDLAERLPKYRSDAKAVELIFWPAHQADRLIRTERWAPEGAP